MIVRTGFWRRPAGCCVRNTVSFYDGRVSWPCSSCLLRNGRSSINEECALRAKGPGWNAISHGISITLAMPWMPMKASEVLQRHGEQRTVHPDAQVQLFLMRAEMPEPVAISKSAIPGPESEEAQFEAAAASVVVRPVDLNPMPDRHSSVRSLMRNRSIALFEGAEPGGSDWGAHRADAAASLGLPYEDRRSTTILFAAPIPPSVPFNPVRLHK